MSAIIFCGLATALGWGLRGEFGGPDGAAIPGAFLGVALALSSGRADWIRKSPVFGMAGTLGFMLGGIMSYGRVIGYTKGIDMVNVTYGYAMLGVIGGLWGSFGAGSIGMAASPKRYRVWEVGVFVAAGWLAGMVVHWLLVAAMGLRMTPPRGDGWANVLGAVLALAGFTAYKRDAVPLRLMFWGFLAGALGFMIGESFQVYGSFLGPPYDWWKVMEQSFGFILGAGICYGLRRECAQFDVAAAPPYWLTVFGIIVVAWFVPVMTFADVVRTFLGDAGIMGADGVDVLFHWRVRYWALLIVGLAFAWHVRTKHHPVAPADVTAKMLFCWVVWSCTVFGLLKKSVPAWHVQSMWVHTGFFILAVTATLWAVLIVTREARWVPARPRLGVWIPVAAVALLFTSLALAFTSIASHPGAWRSDAHVRFGEPPSEE